jgi:hypothetical protein
MHNMLTTMLSPDTKKQAHVGIRFPTARRAVLRRAPATRIGSRTTLQLPTTKRHCSSASRWMCERTNFTTLAVHFFRIR